MLLGGVKVCGIIGVVDKKNKLSDLNKSLEVMLGQIVHRGPDENGVFIKDNVGLAHARLSILDITSGQQPMKSADGRYIIVFNGEIYNFIELRDALIKKGVKFKTKSDTEVILQLYIFYGDECVNMLNGMFAFCIFDSLSGDMYVARDHVGVKPLYYINTSDYFIFSSEIKSILALGVIDARCNDSKLVEYFIYRQVAGAQTLFKGIEVLQPGSYIKYSGNTFNIEKYWESTPSIIDTNITFDEAYLKLSALLEGAVKKQMISDVPLGTFCSGGVDSSLVTAIAALNSNSRINTYSIGFDNEKYDETKYARMVSKKYDTNHHELIVNNRDFSNLFEKAVWHNDLPLNFPNSIMIYALSGLAKESVTVVLTGEGADELFNGYPRYQLPLINKYISGKNNYFNRLAKSIVGGVPSHYARKIAGIMGESLEDALLYNSAQMSSSSLLNYSLLRNEDMISNRREVLSDLKHIGSIVDKASLLDQRTYLLSILNRQDKMSMAASIESRVPILDYEIVQFANTLPSKIKSKLFSPKYMLKKIAQQYLPKELIYRQKSGFGVPLCEWFRDDKGVGEIARDLLTNDNLKELMLVNDISDVIKDHCNQTADHSEFLWSAINYVQWKKTFNVAV